MSKNYLVGFFNVEGHGTQSVETPLTGSSVTDYNELWKLIRAEFPALSMNQIVRHGSTIELRPDDGGIIEFPDGATIQQIFLDDSDGNSRHVGTVDFDGQSHDVVIRYHKAKNCAGINLVARSNKATVRFSDSIPGMKLAAELPELISGIIGSGGCNLNLLFRMV